MTKIRVVVADDYPIIREGLKALFDTQDDMDVVGEAANGDDTAGIAVRVRPDVLVMEMDMPGCHWRQLITQVKRGATTTAILIITEHKEEHYALSTLRAGADGFVNKTRPTRELVDAARQVAKGGVFISPEFSQRLALGALGRTACEAPHEELSPREQEIFFNLAQGLSVGEIAVRLHLSPKTVSTHKTRVFQKLKLENLSSLVRYAMEHGVL